MLSRKLAASLSVVREAVPYWLRSSSECSVQHLHADDVLPKSSALDMTRGAAEHIARLPGLGTRASREPLSGEKSHAFTFRGANASYWNRRGHTLPPPRAHRLASAFVLTTAANPGTSIVPREFSASLVACNAWGASDLGDVIPPAYRDYARPVGRARNETEAGAYCRTLGQRVAEATSNGRFAVVLGGDCSIVLGSLLGARTTAQRSVGLVYVDAHADFGTPAESHTGSVASMCLALAVGRGDTPLARVAGDAPLVRAKDVILIGRPGTAEPWYGHAALAASPISTFRVLHSGNAA